MASYISNVESHLDASGDSNRKKRRKIGEGGGEESGPSQSDQARQSSIIRWKSESEQRIYSTKLVEALRHARRSTSPAEKVRKVREAADRVLAVAAKGTTRWSRAILASRHRLMMRNNRRKHRKVKKVTGKSRLQKPETRTRRIIKLPPLQRKVRTLSRLVPGCRKVPFPNLLEETTDYIAALEMQIRAMAAVAELLTGSPVRSDLNASS